MRRTIYGVWGISMIVAAALLAAEEGNVLEQWWSRLTRTVANYEAELESQQSQGLAQMEIAQAEHRLLLDHARRELGIDVWLAVEARAQAEPGTAGQRAYQQALSAAQQRFQRALSKAHQAYRQAASRASEVWTEEADEGLQMLHEETVSIRPGLREEGWAEGPEEGAAEETEEEWLPEKPEIFLQIPPPVAMEGEDNPTAQLRKALAEARTAYETALTAAAAAYQPQVQKATEQVQQGAAGPFAGGEEMKKALKVYKLVTLDALETWRAAVRQAIQKYQLANV